MCCLGVSLERNALLLVVSQDVYIKIRGTVSYLSVIYSHVTFPVCFCVVNTALGCSDPLPNRMQMERAEGKSLLSLWDLGGIAFFDRILVFSYKMICS